MVSVMESVSYLGLKIEIMCNQTPSMVLKHLLNFPTFSLLQIFITIVWVVGWIEWVSEKIIDFQIRFEFIMLKLTSYKEVELVKLNNWNHEFYPFVLMLDIIIIMMMRMMMREKQKESVIKWYIYLQLHNFNNLRYHPSIRLSKPQSTKIIFWV
jgi:hypothetical protein